MFMTLQADLQALVPVQILKWFYNPFPALPPAIKDLPRDVMGVLPRNRWELYPSTHLVTGLPFAGSTEDLKMDHYSSTSSMTKVLEAVPSSTE